MIHECDDCGESFETLTRLRLHDCGDVQSETVATTSSTDESTSSSPTEERNTSIAELDDLLDGEPEIIQFEVDSATELDL